MASVAAAPMQTPTDPRRALLYSQQANGTVLPKPDATEFTLLRVDRAVDPCA